MKRCRSISCIVYFSGLLIFFIIFGSSEDGIESMGSILVVEVELQIEEYFLSRSWYGIFRDEIDFVLEDYEIILFNFVE